MSRLQGPSPLCVPAPFVGTFGGAVGLFYVWVLLPKRLKLICKNNMKIICMRKKINSPFVIPRFLRN